MRLSRSLPIKLLTLGALLLPAGGILTVAGCIVHEKEKEKVIVPVRDAPADERDRIDNERR